MGSIIKPICSCGAPFNELFLGGGKMNFLTVCDVPSVCMHCGTITDTNILDNHHPCRKCKAEMILFGRIISFEDLNLYNPATHYVFTWDIDLMLDRTYVLDDKLYTCPICKEENLKFEDQGCWD